MEVGSPFRFARRGIQTPAPRLGEHTREILTAAGYSEGDLDSLEEKGVIKQG
jgi:formyl-CoA transferase